MEPVDPMKKHHSIPDLKYPAWHVCAGSALVSGSSSDIKGPRSSSWDVYLPPSLEAAPSKRTIAFLTISGVAISLHCTTAASHSWDLTTHTDTHTHTYTHANILSISLVLALTEEKGKLPHLWVQLQMCQGSGVKHESTRMWRSPPKKLVRSVSIPHTAPSKRPHFMVAPVSR